MGETSVITYEQLYNLVRNEKINEELQKINPDTYSQIVYYLKTKIVIYKDAQINKLVPHEIEKIKSQINSARKLIKDFYERRERKIMALAINKSRTKFEKIDDSGLLQFEKEIFKKATELLIEYRTGVLLNLVNAKIPTMIMDNKIEPKITKELSEPKLNPNLESKPELKLEPLVHEKTNITAIQETNEPRVQEDQIIRFLKPVAKFLGKNLEIYGPFKEGDIAKLDKDIANVIIKKEYAQVMNV